MPKKATSKKTPRKSSARPIQSSTQTPESVRTVVTILLLIFLPLFGLISMWIWTTWSKTIKWIITAVFLSLIPILAILLSITLIAINPAHQFAQANNTKRRSDVYQILTAINNYQAKNMDKLPDEILGLPTNTPTELSSSTSLKTLCDKLIGTYTAVLPVDPTLNTTDVTTCTGSWSTGYAISRDENNRVTVSALTPDENQVIQVTR